MYLFMSDGSASIKKDIKTNSTLVKRFGMLMSGKVMDSMLADTFSYTLKRAYRTKTSGLFDVYNLLDEAEANKNKALEEVEDYKKRNEQLERQILKNKNRSEARSSSFEELQKQNKELKSKLGEALKNDTTKLTSEIESLREEIAALKKENNGLSLEIADQKKKNSKLMKDTRKLEIYVDTYGELNTASDDDTADEEISGVTYEEMLDELIDLKIAVVTCSPFIMDKFRGAGFKNVRFIDEENSAALDYKFDVLIIFADYCTHKICYSARNMADKMGAFRMYYTGANIEHLVRSLYNMINK